jgi:hypothetical protein
MQGIRKILRTLAIMIFTALSGWLFIDAGVHGAGEYQLLIATGLLAFAAGLVITWFWSPFG